MTPTQERPAAAPEPVIENLVAEGPQEDLLRPRRWTTAEYYALSDAGFFDDERVELLDGEIWTLPLQGTPHFYSTDVTGDVLLEVFGDGFIVRRHGPITLEDGTEPEPDVVIVPGSKRDYIPSHPVPSSGTHSRRSLRCNTAERSGRKTPHLRPRGHRRLLDRQPRQPSA